MITWALSGLVLCHCVPLSCSLISFAQLNRKGHFNRRAVLVGGGAAAEHVIATLERQPRYRHDLLGVFDDRDEGARPSHAEGLQKLGTVDDLIDFVRSTRIDTLILTLPVTAENRLMEILKRLWVLPVDIRLSAQDQRLRYRPRAYSYIGNLALLDLFDRPLGDWGPFIKICGRQSHCRRWPSCCLRQLFAAVAMAVNWTARARCCFEQKRYGFNNELIEVYKFRSMYMDMADAHATQAGHQGRPSRHHGWHASFARPALMNCRNCSMS